MKICQSCGERLSETHRFCPTCGVAVGEVYTEKSAGYRTDITQANADLEKSFVRSIVGTALAPWPFASIAGIVLGHKALKEVERLNELSQRGGFRLSGKRIATKVLGLVGKITGIAMTCFWCFYLLILVIALAVAYA